MEVIQAIRKLLFLEDCVIIPGFGGFVAQYRPASIDPVNGIFVPPAKEIVFNAELLQNDGILTGFIARLDGITAVAARIKVEMFVEDSLKTLGAGKPVKIEGVGQFMLNGAGTILFQAVEGTGTYSETFGLEPIAVREIIRENSETAAPVVVHQPESEPVTSEFRVSPGRSAAARNLRRVAVAVPLLIVFSLMPYNPRISETLTSSRVSMIPEPSLYRLNYPDTQLRDTARTIVFPIGDSVWNETDTVQEQQTPATETPAEELNTIKATPVTPEPEPAPKPVVESRTGKYPVVAGCFKIQENAEKLQKQLADKGYPADIVPMRNGMFKVRMQTFATREEAVKGLAELRKAEPGLDLWLAL